MTPRQRVITALNREEPDRVPFELSFGSFVPALMEIFREKTGAEDPAEHWNYPVRSVSHCDLPAAKRWQIYRPYFPDLPDELPPDHGISSFGSLSKGGYMYHFARTISPLRHAATPRELEDYPLPDYSVAAHWGHLDEEVARLHARDLAVQGDLYCTLFEAAWAIRGLEEMLTDFVLNPEMAEILLDRLLEIRLGQTRRLVEAGIDVLRLGDDVSGQTGMLMSPAIWRQWLKPRLSQIIDLARELNPDIHIFYHSDGDCRAIIPELIEIGVTVLNPVQPECLDPEEIKRDFGDRLALWGTIGTQSTMPHGTPDEVREMVRRRIETVGRGGGLLIAPSHILEPDVPWENVVAFVEAVKESMEA